MWLDWNIFLIFQFAQWDGQNTIYTYKIHLSVSLRSPSPLCFVLIHMFVWASLCGVMCMYVQSLTLEVWFHIHRLKGEISRRSPKVSDVYERILGHYSWFDGQLWFSMQPTQMKCAQKPPVRNEWTFRLSPLHWHPVVKLIYKLHKLLLKGSGGIQPSTKFFT